MDAWDHDNCQHLSSFFRGCSFWAHWGRVDAYILMVSIKGYNFDILIWSKSQWKVLINTSCWDPYNKHMYRMNTDLFFGLSLWEYVCTFVKYVIWLNCWCFHLNYSFLFVQKKSRFFFWKECFKNIGIPCYSFSSISICFRERIISLWQAA